MSTVPLSSASPPPPPRSTPRKAGGGFKEGLIEFILLCCGLVSVLITFGIVYVILLGAFRFFQDPGVSVAYFFTGTEWSALFETPGEGSVKYGILPLVVGTTLIALIAGLVAIPVGLTTAIYMSEYASPKVRAVIKPTLELLAGIPTVVYGYFAITVVTPFLALFIPGLESQNQLAGGIVVGIMILPMVASLSEDALRAVPRSLREGSYALGATQFETSVKVVLPAALSGILASFVLAISRAIGETMAVTLACGTSYEFTLDPRQGIATMTSFIVDVSLGDAPHGTTRFNSLFAVAAVLFFTTLTMNVLAQGVLRRYRQVYQ